MVVVWELIKSASRLSKGRLGSFLFFLWMVSVLGNQLVLGQVQGQGPGGPPPPGSGKKIVPVPATAGGPPPVRLRITDPEAVLVKLTAHAWGEAGKTFVQFHRDGTNLRKVTTPVPWGACGVGVPNYDRPGKWTIQWKEDHGLLQLENGDIVALAFAEKHCFFVDRWLPQIPPQEPPRNKPALSNEQLSKFQPNPLYTKIAGARWRKSNSFDLFMYPTSVQFDSYGRFGAQFREGECKTGGIWSLVEQGQRLLTVSEENKCDLRGPGTGSIGDSPAALIFQDDLVLFHGTSYRLESSKDVDQVFVFDQFSGSVRVTGRFRGALKKGVPVKLELTFLAISGDFDLDSVGISQSTLEFNGRGFSQVGEARQLAFVPLSIRLPHEKSIKREIELVPVVSGPFSSIDFDFRYKDIRQDYRGRKGYFMAIAP